MDNKTKAAYEAAKKKAKKEAELSRANKGATAINDSLGLGGLKKKIRSRQKMLDDI